MVWFAPESGPLRMGGEKHGSGARGGQGVHGWCAHATAKKGSKKTEKWRKQKVGATQKNQQQQTAWAGLEQLLELTFKPDMSCRPQQDTTRHTVRDMPQKLVTGFEMGILGVRRS